MDIGAAIAAERRRIADLVESLSPAQLEVPSLCGAWTVRQVAGHLLAASAPRPGPALGALVASGFRLHRANARLAIGYARRSPAELADGLRRHSETAFRPPVVGFPGQLTDLLVHGQDMRRPLGLPHGLDLDRLRVALDFLTGGRAIGFTPRRRLAGLRLEATDVAWSAGAASSGRDSPGHDSPGRDSPGHGPLKPGFPGGGMLGRGAAGREPTGAGLLVAGPAEALMMAVTGRRAALTDLDGPGVRLLTARLPGP